MQKIDEDQLRVAKLFIAGWIRDWSCLTLMNAVNERLVGGMGDIERLHSKYKFLPSDWFWFYNKNGKLANKYLKKYVADLDTRLNNALWDTDDNMKKLAFASYLTTLDSTSVKSKSKYSKDDKKAYAKAIKGNIANRLSVKHEREFNQKMNGTHWTTIK